MAHRSPFFALFMALAVLLGAHVAQASAPTAGIPMKTQRYFSDRFREGEAKAMEAYTVSMTSAVPTPRKLSDSSDSDAPVRCEPPPTPPSADRRYLFARYCPRYAVGPPPPPPCSSTNPPPPPTSPLPLTTSPTHTHALHPALLGAAQIW